MDAIAALDREEIGQDREAVAVVAVLDGCLQGIGERARPQVLLNGQRLGVIVVARGRRNGVCGLPDDVRQVAGNPEEIIGDGAGWRGSLGQGRCRDFGCGRENHVALCSRGGFRAHDAQGVRVPGPSTVEAVDGGRGERCGEVGAGELAGADGSNGINDFTLDCIARFDPVRTCAALRCAVIRRPGFAVEVVNGDRAQVKRCAGAG
ncbi:hypothetical protein PJL18_04184 [Paenarthrobacter nicotinovorans]|nr:hypothetical protein [Paenarthrobacter nicotinovorans]